MMSLAEEEEPLTLSLFSARASALVQAQRTFPIFVPIWLGDFPGNSD